MNYWNQKSIPHKGWYNQGYEDLEQATHVCDMCGKEEIRYVHTMYHPLVDNYFRVGQVCAEKLTEDYETAKKQIKLMKKRSSWTNGRWKVDEQFDSHTKSFNSTYGRTEVTVFKVDNEYKISMFDRIFKVSFDSVKEAKAFVYDKYVD